MPKFDGLIPLSEGGAKVREITGTENDPVARAATRDRRVRTVTKQNPDLVVRIGGRYFILDQRSKVMALAEALGVSPATPKPPRAKRATSNLAAVSA
jgi:alcohol dehydrogenase YqhD (iron-dependent ADH family)